MKNAESARMASAVPTAQQVGQATSVEPMANEPPAQIIVDPPLAEPLSHGQVLIQYRTEHLRIVPVFGSAALAVSPRIGHLHVSVDNAPWHWVDASGLPLAIVGLPPGPHKVLIQLANANHQPLDQSVVEFTIPTGLTHTGHQ